jgi:hypothetical protein
MRKPFKIFTKPESIQPEDEATHIREENKYEKHILNLQTIEGFYDKWCNLISYYKTHEEAYEALEESYLFYFGRRKYKTYDSFRVSVQNWRKNVNNCKEAK